MSRWFRFHADALHNPKVQRLDGDTFKSWVNLLCMACEAGESGGALPTVADIAFTLRISEEDADALVDRLVAARLLDESEESGLTPHNWAERQYLKSTSRVQQFRKRKDETHMKRDETVSPAFHGVSETPMKHLSETRETPPESDTEADTESEAEQKQSRVGAESKEPVATNLPQPAHSPAPAHHLEIARASTTSITRKSPDFHVRYESLYRLHPLAGFKGDGQLQYLEILSNAVDSTASADAIDRAHGEWRAFWDQHPTEYQPGIGKWLSDGYYLRRPKARDSPILRKTKQQEQADAWDRA